MLLSVVLLVTTVSLTVTHVEGKKRRHYRNIFECETCQQVVDNFKRGLERTKKYSYADKKGETRFVEIYEELCKGANEECPRLLEEYEELIEKFWYSDEFETNADAFHKFLCIENVKACCPKGTYGPDCQDCSGGKVRPCRGNGRCDGSGERVGNGLCVCNDGYKGQLCEQCSERHFEVVNNDTHTICQECHKSCRTTCTGPGPKECYDCGEGWKFVRDRGCRDLNECLEKPCGENEYCANKPGSFICRECDPSCGACYGRGNAKCRFCKDGYLMNDSMCLDIDECQSSGHEDLCTKPGEFCENLPGNYTCLCRTGYVRDEKGYCAWETKEAPKPKKPKSDKKQVPKCSLCKEVVDNFRLGLEHTKQKHYEGGNSEWEKSRLGRYPDSELRLVEATDELCFDASKECPQILEDYEELIEDFWFKSGLPKEAEAFHQYFCIENVKACCPNNTYGPNCTACSGGVERPCKGNGVCDGEGTREGTGACNCSEGYQGDLCDSCTADHYETFKNETHTVCTACHESCKNCSGEGPKACGECKEGWFNTVESGCKACHESCKNCTADGPTDCGVCKEGYYAKGKVCQACHESCKNCTGDGPKACGECKEGWTHKGEDFGCQDKNECDTGGEEDPCLGEGGLCENTEGSFICNCRPGFTKSPSGACVFEKKGDSTPVAKDGESAGADIPKAETESMKSSADETADQSSKTSQDSAESTHDQTAKDSSQVNKDSAESSGDPITKEPSKASKDSAKGSGSQTTKDSSKKTKDTAKGSGDSSDDSKEEL